MLKLHPALLNFALMILVKSSKSVYNETQPVFKFSTYSRLKQIQRETTGSQLLEMDLRAVQTSS